MGEVVATLSLFLLVRVGITHSHKFVLCLYPDIFSSSCSYQRKINSFNFLPCSSLSPSLSPLVFIMLPKQGFATWCVILNAESYEWFLVDYISAVGYGLFDSIFILAGIRVKVVDCISIVPKKKK